MLHKLFFITSFIYILFASITALAQGTGFSTDLLNSPNTTPATSIKLAVKPLAPFVIEDKGQYSGFSIDLWNSIAKNLNINTIETKAYPNVNALIDGVASNQSNVGIAGVSITAERENKIDFSYPMFRSGLSILTTNSTKSSVVPEIFTKIASAVWNYDFAVLALSMVLISLIPATIIYFVERRFKDGFLDTRNVLLGIFLSYCWCFTGIFGQEDRHPATKTGKVFGLVWMVFGVLFLAFFTAQVTANLTTDKLNGSIHGIEDIKGKKVATLKGTTSSQYLKDNSIDFIEYANLDQAVASIDNKDTVAVVYDKPALQYYAANNKNNKYTVISGSVTTEDYGIVLPTSSLLRKPINEQLLKMYQSGEYDSIKTKWFGKADGS